MHYSTAALSLTAIAAAGVAFAQNTFSTNTPTVFLTCQPSRITWVGGQAPYFPRITAPGDTSNTLRSFDQTSEMGLTWNVDLAADQSVTIAVGDSAGQTAPSNQVAIRAGGSTSCVRAAGGTASGGSSSAGGSSSSGSSSQASSSSSSSRPSSSSSSSAPSSSSSASTPASSSSASRPASTTAAATSSPSGGANGADSIRGFSAVVAGVVGVAAAALL